MKLTENFTLDEMLRSEYADANGVSEQYKPSEDVVKALTKLCEVILQPLRDYVFQKHGAIIKVNSGYRCPKVNKAIGGSSTSQHVQGEAADIVLLVRGTVRNDLLVQSIIEIGNTLPYDQIIWEFGASAKNPAWVHISHNADGKQRGMQLRPLGKGKYEQRKLF